VKCKDIVKELADYLDEDLDPALRQSIEQHLGNCKDCRLVVDTTKQTIQIYCNSEPAPLPAETRSKLHDALAKRLHPAP
jgi:predicted anti-sigma-YlaC factor YlaD